MKKSERTIQTTIARGLLLPAFVMLLVAALAFVTATYAWISTSVNYNVDDISMSAGTSDTGVLVSADCDTWTNAIGLAELAAGYEGSRNVLPSNAIAPVSSSGQLDGGLVFYSGRTTLAGDVIAERISEPTAQSLSGDYYAYDLFFRVDREATLYLGSGSYVRDTAQSRTPVSASARVAFVNYGNSEESSDARALSEPVTNEFHAGYKAVEPGTLQDIREIYYRLDGGEYTRIDNNDLDWRLYYELLEAGNLYVTDNSAVIETPLRVWEPNATTHTASVTTTGALETRAVTAAGTIGGDNTAPLGENVLFNDLNGFRRDSTFVATVSPGYNKVRIYIWIEGQDADAINEVGGRSFSTNLNFVIG